MSLSSRRIGGGGGGDDFENSSSSFRSSSSSSSSSSNYQVYRGMSPTTSNRIENRIKELEEALEQERSVSAKGYKEIAELHIQLDGLHERIEESEAETSAQVELNRKKEQDYLKLKKDYDLLTAQQEASETSLKKKHQDVVNDLTEQLDRANKQKSKFEKEKQTLVIEIESYTTQLDAANKNRGFADSKLEQLEEQVKKFKSQIDELTRVNQELVSVRSRLTQENSDLHRQLQDAETNVGSFSKVKIQIQTQLDEYKAKYEEESRVRGQLDNQFGNLQVEFDRLHASWEDESEAATNLRAQLQKLQAEYQQLKLKYDKDIVSKTEETDEIRRKLSARISELESEAEGLRNRTSRLEKEKSKITIEINEISVQLDSANNLLNDHAKRLKQTEHLNVELTKRVEELNGEVQRGGSDFQNAQAELNRLRTSVGDLQAKIDALARDNSKLSDALRESESGNKDLTRQVSELTSIRNELQGGLNALNSEFGDARDEIKELQSRLDGAINALNQLKAEAENRLREKSEELETIKRSSQNTIEELRRSVADLEMRLKSETSRLKKKYEIEHHEFEIQIDTLNRNNADLAKTNKNLATKLKETEVSLEAERRSAGEARDAATLLERRIISFQMEIDDVRSLLESAEKARKKAELELSENSSHVTEINITITNLTGEKRRLEADLLAVQHGLDEAVHGRRSAEEKAEKLALELARITEQLRREQENCSSLEQTRKQLEINIREITIRLEEVESTKDGKKALLKLQSRVVELEKELDLEQRRGRDTFADNKRLQKQLADLRLHLESEHRLVIEYTETINNFQGRLTSIKRQLEHSEDVVSITMSKYRKCQQQLEETERRADRAEKNISVVRHTTFLQGVPSGRARALSVSREVTKVIRV